MPLATRAARHAARAPRSPCSFFLCCATAGARRRASTTRWRSSSTTSSPAPSRAISALAATGARQRAGDPRGARRQPPADRSGAHILVYQTTARRRVRRQDRREARQRRRRFVQEGARQQRAAQRDRRGDRRADPRQSRSAKARRRRRSGVQVARRQGAAGASRRNSPRRPIPAPPTALRQARAAIVVLDSDDADAPTASPRSPPEGARRPGRAEPDRRGRAPSADDPAVKTAALRGAWLRSRRVSRCGDVAAERAGTASPPPRCCCSPPSASPSPSA